MSLNLWCMLEHKHMGREGENCKRGAKLCTLTTRYILFNCDALLAFHDFVPWQTKFFCLLLYRFTFRRHRQIFCHHQTKKPNIADTCLQEWDHISNLIFLDEGDERGSLDLDGLAGAVVEGDDEVEEVGLAEVRRRLLLEVGTPDSRSHAETEISKTELKSCPWSLIRQVK